ncbi:MAG: TonB-dependent receptor, partial [Myxococcaceae bacterium]|nr:TonB-dependent receptor [Myxococcaceae bacterium]
IRGTVRAKDSKGPLPEATVTVTGTDKVVSTDEEGRFEMTGLAPGEYQLQVSFPVHKDAFLPVKLAAGETANVEAALELEENVFGQEMVVVGTKFPEKRLESPVTIETVRPKDIQISGGATYMAALAKVKGVDYTETGVGEKRISARGFNSQFNSRMLSMVDGRLAQQPGNGLPQAGTVPTTSLDIYSIDVVVGPASALYGANAHAGVVNITTKTPWDESGASVALRGGTYNLMDGAARLAGTINDSFGWRVSGQLTRGTDFVPDPNSNVHKYGAATKPLIYEGDLVGDYTMGGAKAEGYLYYRAGDWSLRGGYGFSTSDGVTLTNVGRNELQGWQVHYQTVQAHHQNWFAHVTRTATSAGKSYQLDALASKIQAANVDVNDEAAVDELRQANLFKDASQMYDSELQYRNAFGDLKLTTGVQFRAYMPDSDGSYLADTGDTTIQFSELGGYVQADYGLIPEKLRVVGAARLDGHSDYSPQFSPKLALAYSINKLHNLRLGYNRAFKSPSALENYLLIGGYLLGNKTGFTVKTYERNPDGTLGAEQSSREIAPLSPEEVNSLELGYKGSIANKLYVDVVGYHSWYNNFISPLTARTGTNVAAGTVDRAFYPDGKLVAEGTPLAGTLFTYSNFGRARVWGADFGLDYSPIPELTFSGSFSYIKMQSFHTNDRTQKALLLNVPTTKLKGSVTLENVGVKDTFLRLSGRYQNAYDFASGRWVSAILLADQGGVVPERFVADLALGYTFPMGLGVSLNVANLFDNKGVDILGAAPGGRYGYLQLSYRMDGLRF